MCAGEAIMQSWQGRYYVFMAGKILCIHGREDIVYLWQGRYCVFMAGKILCIHGGLGESVHDIEQIRALKVPPEIAQRACVHVSTHRAYERAGWGGMWAGGCVLRS